MVAGSRPGPATQASTRLRTFLEGISLWMSNLNTISGLPAGFSKIALYDLGGLPISFYYGVVLVAAFAAVFLGTAIIEPGRSNPIGTFIGIYFLETGILGLQLLGLQAWVSPVFYGGVLVVAVTISTLLHRRTT